MNGNQQPADGIDAGKDVAAQADDALLSQDVDGGTAKGKKGLSIRGTPAAGGARLSKNFKKVAFIAGGAIAGGMVIGIMTAGNKASAPAESEGQSQMVGQTSPDISAMQRAAARAGGASAPAAASSAPRGPAPKASGPGAALTSPSAALAANGNPQQFTPAQKYHQWLEEQHYKDLEGAVLAAQSAQLSKTAPDGGLALAGPRQPQSDKADELRRLALAAAPHGANADSALQKALAGLQQPGGAPQSPQQANTAFLDAAASKADNGYLPAAVQPPIGNHELFAGSVIPAVMLTGIDSDLPGTITAQVRQTVYDSLNPDVVLIPQGTRIVGAYSSDVAYGQSRVLVAWNRLIFPNGAMIDLKGMSGTDGEGQAGFHDQVDNHYMRIFGSAILMSLLGVGAQLSQPQNAGALNTPSASQQAASALAQQMDNVGTNLLNKNLSIQPTLNIQPGYAFNVLVNRTMILPPYSGR
jgi:type IV secretion system protein VirB10